MEVIEGLDESELSVARYRRSESQVFAAFSFGESADDRFYDAREAEDETPTSDFFVVTPGTKPLLSVIDSVCPMWIEMCSNRGGYSRVYAINVASGVTFRSDGACEDLVRGSSLSQVVHDTFSPRMSTAERMRRSVAVVLSKDDGKGGRVASFMGRTDCTVARDFLNRKEPHSERERSLVLFSGFVARALSDHHWIEEWATVTSRCISFYHPDKRKPQFRIPMSSVTRVDRLTSEMCPKLPQHSFLVVETLGRSIYLMFSSEEQRDSWLHEIHRVLSEDTASVSSKESSVSSVCVEIGNHPAEEFLHKSSMWSCKNRRILNCRQFSFCSSETTSGEALARAEKALCLAMEDFEDPIDGADRRRAFLDAAAALKQVSAYGLSEKEKLTFFLNLYHGEYH